MKLAMLIGLVVISSARADSRKPDPKLTAKLVVQKYAYEAYPQWAVSNPSKACPAKLAELDEFMNKDETTDPWGHPYVMFCGATVPKGVKGLGVLSAGPDGKPNTADDIKSWE